MESVPDEAGQPAEGVLHARRISSAAAPDAEIPGSLDFCHLYPPRLCFARAGNSDRADRSEAHIRAENSLLQPE